jgi:hypothetical protein
VAKYTGPALRLGGERQVKNRKKPRPLIPRRDAKFTPAAPGQTRAVGPHELLAMGFGALLGPPREPVCWRCWTAGKWNVQMQVRVNDRTVAYASVFHCDLHKPDTGDAITFEGRPATLLVPPPSEAWQKSGPRTT